MKLIEIYKSILSEGKTKFYDPEKGKLDGHRDHTTETKNAKMFKDKTGKELMIYLVDDDSGYKTVGVFDVEKYEREGWVYYEADNEFRREMVTRYHSKDNIATLFVKRESDGKWRSDGTLSDAMWVKSTHRRRGIAGTMHDYYNDILNIETAPSTGAQSQDAKYFWKNRNK